MARPAADAKGGYYACPIEAVVSIARYLKPPSQGEWCMLDVCAGEGLAVKQLAELLGCPPERVHAVELEDVRSITLQDNLPGSRVLAPCSFFGCEIRRESFSLVYCNPPFTEGLQGGRVETRFVSDALDLLVKDGVIVVIVPASVSDLPAMRNLLLTYCDDLSLFAFAPEYRRFNEVVILGRRREQWANPNQRQWRMVCGRPHEYLLPKSFGPGQRFKKTGYVESELLADLDKSPLRKLLEPPKEKPLPRPPLALGAGHLALLLASGHLDGLVQPPGEAPHVVRGTCHKTEEVADETEEADGSQKKTVTTIVERIRLTVRVIDESGNLSTLVQQ